MSGKSLKEGKVKDNNWVVDSGCNGRIRVGESDFEGTFMALVGH